MIFPIELAIFVADLHRAERAIAERSAQPRE